MAAAGATSFPGGGGVVTFLRDHRGSPIPPPALFAPIGEACRRAGRRFAEEQGIPLIAFRARQDKLATVRPLLDSAAATGREGLVAIGVAHKGKTSPCGEHRLHIRSGSARRPPGRGVEGHELGRSTRFDTVYDVDIAHSHAVLQDWAQFLFDTVSDSRLGSSSVPPAQ